VAKTAGEKGARKSHPHRDAQISLVAQETRGYLPVFGWGGGGWSFYTSRPLDAEVRRNTAQRLAFLRPYPLRLSLDSHASQGTIPSDSLHRTVRPWLQSGSLRVRGCFALGLLALDSATRLCIILRCTRLRPASGFQMFYASRAQPFFFDGWPADDVLSPPVLSMRLSTRFSREPAGIGSALANRREVRAPANLAAHAVILRGADASPLDAPMLATGLRLAPTLDP
jgi:hypothetical protein